MDYYKKAAHILTKVFNASKLPVKVEPEMVELLVDEQQKERERSIVIMKRIKEFLEDAGYECDRENLLEEGAKKDVVLSGRIKTIVSAMYNLLALKNGKHQDLNDMIGIMIICQDKKTCYDISDLMLKKCLENNCRVISQKDMIIEPKKNGYQSIHIHVLDSMGYVFEIQIKSYKMFAFSQTGDCKHELYKKKLDLSKLSEEEWIIFESLREETWF